MKTGASLIFRLLIAVIAVAASGCHITDNLSQAAEGTPSEYPVFLKVQKCYLTPAGKLAVFANGGILKNESSKAPPSGPVWFEIDIPSLHAKDGSQVLDINVTQDSFEKGWPDPAKLFALGFVEVPFREYLQKIPKTFQEPRDPNPIPIAGEPLQPGIMGVQVRYLEYQTAGSPNSLLGFMASFKVQGVPNLPEMDIFLEEMDSNSKPLLWLGLPFTIILDVITFPLQPPRC